MKTHIQIEQAKKLHQQGHLREASLIYEAVLKSDPENAESMHLLGLVAAQSGKHELAVNWITKALAINPQNSKFHNNLGTALLDSKLYAKAIASYDAALRFKPDFADAYYNKSLALVQLKEWDSAVQSLQHALLHESEFFEALYLLGNTLQEVGRFDEAITSYKSAIDINSNYAPLFYNLGNAFKAKRQFKTAIENYNKSLAIDPNFVDAYVNRGVALKESMQIEEAIKSYKLALNINSDCVTGFFNLGNAYKENHQYELAVISYDNAIRLDASNHEVYLNKGVALTELRLLDEALKCYDAALLLKADYPEAYFNYGNTLSKLLKFDDALNCYEKALFFRKEYKEAYFNKGNIFLESSNPQAAISNYDSAIALDADYLDAYWNKSHALLLEGNFEYGWDLYEIRRRDNQKVKPRTFPQYAWLGKESIQGKTILIHAEQGLGDTLQFIRYVPMVAALGATVIVEVQAPLLSLFENMQGISVLLKKGDPLPAFDMHCPMMSLPLAFKTTLDTVPACPQFVIPEAKTQFWSDKLGLKAKPRVGLVWNGGFRPDQPEIWDVNERRNLPLQHLKALVGIDVEFISLQKGEPAETEFRQSVAAGWDGPHIHDHVHELKDFSDTAALVMNLDLVIAVDTSTAYLAASLGKPVWLLNRYDTCWRWLLDREDSPWYPSIKIYRQTSSGDWDGVMQRVRADLLALSASATRL